MWLKYLTMANRTKRDFTVLELLVALAVTAVLSGLLLTISVQVLNTQKQSSNDLETNQVAQLVLDRIEEDLQCALFRNDGNVWMELSMQMHPINTDWQERNPESFQAKLARYLSGLTLLCPQALLKVDLSRMRGLVKLLYG